MANTPDLDLHLDEPEPVECGEGDGDELIACGGEEEDLEAVATNVSAEAATRVASVYIGKPKLN